jgi:hypothetical protein
MKISAIDFTPAVGHESSFTSKSIGGVLGLSDSAEEYMVLEQFRDFSTCKVIRDEQEQGIDFVANETINNNLTFHDTSNDYFSCTNGILTFTLPFVVDIVSKPVSVIGSLTYAIFHLVN